MRLTEFIAMKVDHKPAHAKEVPILVPNYRTPEITKICMRLLRKHTDPERTLSNDQLD